MIKADPEYAWLVRQAILERRKLCDESGIHIIADDLTHACSHADNTGEIDIFMRDNIFYKRCNLPFCPHKTEVHNNTTSARS